MQSINNRIDKRTAGFLSQREEMHVANAGEEEKPHFGRIIEKNKRLSFIQCFGHTKVFQGIKTPRK